MKTEELYAEVLGIVSFHVGMPSEEILSSRREECADARFLLVYALSLRLTDNEIARLVGKTRQGVNFIKNAAGKLRKWSVASNWQAISKELASKDWWSK